MDHKEVFSQLLRYFPKGEEGLLRKNLCLFAQACLAAGEFAQAQTYADMLLAQEPDDEQKMTAWHIRLYVKLQCRNDKEFLHCPAFSKELPEYLELLSACSSNEQKLKRLIGLANENLRTVTQDREAEERRKREEEQRRQEEEQRRLAQEAERRRLRKMCIFSMILSCIASLFLFAGIVVWCAFGGDMPYLFPTLGWLFAAAAVFYLLSLILPKVLLSNRRRKREGYYVSGGYYGS